jgi:actin
MTAVNAARTKVGDETSTLMAAKQALKTKVVIPAVIPASGVVTGANSACQKTVVIDNGSGMMKVGCGGADFHIDFEAIVGVPKYPFVMIDTPEHTKEATIAAPGKKRELHDPQVDPYSGNYTDYTETLKPAVGRIQERSQFRGVTKVSYPMVHGIIRDWPQMKVLWDFGLSKLGVQAGPDSTAACKLSTGADCADPATLNFLLTEPPLNPKKNREEMTDLFLTKYGAQGVYIGIQAVLALFATDSTTGLVVDIGDGVTHIVPIVEGYAIPHAIRRMDLGGRDLSQYMARMLSEEPENVGRFFTTSAELEIAKYIKEARGYVAYKDGTPNHFGEVLSEYTADKDTAWVMPDHQVITVGTAQFRVAEPLFKPELIGVESPGIPSLIVESVSACDVDVRPKLYGRMVLSGGSSMFKNMKERIIDEVDRDTRTHLDKSMYVFMDITGPNPAKPHLAKDLVWEGANRIAMLPAMDKLWFKKEEWSMGDAGKVDSLWMRQKPLM